MQILDETPLPQNLLSIFATPLIENSPINLASDLNAKIFAISCIKSPASLSIWLFQTRHGAMATHILRRRNSIIHG
jgi:hypothetical protein